MPELIPWFLLLHVLGAIIAFGPVYAFPIIGAMGGKEPMHGNFATRVSEAISSQRVLPFALSMPVTGIGLIWAAGIDPFSRGSRWLLLGILLYTVLLTYALAIQRPTVERIIAMTSGPPPDASAGTPSGPPPGLMDAARKVQRGGAFTGLLILVIVFLMVVKPNLGF